MEEKSGISLDLSLRCVDSNEGESISAAALGSGSGKIILCREVEDAILSCPPAESRFFPCRYCQRKFCNSQALGGHQNAHRYERRASALRGAQSVEAPEFADPFQTKVGVVPASFSLAAFSDLQSGIGQWRKAFDYGEDFGHCGSLSNRLNLVLQRSIPFSGKSPRSLLQNLSRLEEEERGHAGGSLDSAEKRRSSVSASSSLNPSMQVEYQEAPGLDLSLRL